MEDKKIVKIEDIFKDKDSLEFIRINFTIINDLLKKYDKIDFSILNENIDSIERTPSLYDLEYNNSKDYSKEIIMCSEKYNDDFKIIINKKDNNEETK